MNEMNQKKLYVWRLAAFLHQHGMRMSGDELADHLNRNNFLTSYGTLYEGKRGIYKLIKETWKWVHEELGLTEEADKIPMTFPTPQGDYPFE